MGARKTKFGGWVGAVGNSIVCYFLALVNIFKVK